MVTVTYFDRCNEQNSTDIGKKGRQNLSSRDSHSRRNLARELLFWKLMNDGRTTNMS